MLWICDVRGVTVPDGNPRFYEPASGGCAPWEMKISVFVFLFTENYVLGCILFQNSPCKITKIHTKGKTTGLTELFTHYRMQPETCYNASKRLQRPTKPTTSTFNANLCWAQLMGHQTKTWCWRQQRCQGRFTTSAVASEYAISCCRIRAVGHRLPAIKNSMDSTTKSRCSQAMPSSKRRGRRRRTRSKMWSHSMQQ